MNYAAKEIAALEAAVARALNSLSGQQATYAPKTSLRAKLTRALASVAVTTLLFSGVIAGLTGGADSQTIASNGTTQIASR
jgi:hypothetical protein